MRALALALALAAGPALGAGGAPGTALLADPSAICRDAARVAADRHGVPASVMLAITLVETRRRVAGISGPWPWTLNIAGRGYWFDSRAEARAAAEAALEQGQRSIDLGCFQVNHRWHGMHFADLDAMLDPVINAGYAARFLAQLHAESGDWMIAAGRYHSRTPEHFERYRGLVERAIARSGPPTTASARSARTLPPPHPQPPGRRGYGGLPLPRGARLALVTLGPAAPAAGPERPGGVRLGPLAPGARRPLLSPAN